MDKLKEYIDSLKRKRVAVIGAGISNTPLIEALLDAGIDTVIRDMRSEEQLGSSVRRFIKAGAEFKSGDDYLDKLTEDVIFRTPGLMPRNPELRKAAERGAVLTSEMEAFFEICPCRIIGITGSDGKTTTTAITTRLLEARGITAHMGGNIGNPLLCRAGDMKADDFAVVELSSFQLITMQKSPDIAIITNITPNHLDIHRDYYEYVQAKRNIFMHQKPDGKTVLNYGNEVTRSFAGEAPGDVLFFSSQGAVDNGAYLADDGIIYISGQSSPTGAAVAVMPASGILLPGIHNVDNYLAAFAALGGLVSTDVMAGIAQTFGGVAHRLELVREIRGVKYYNDSIASSPTRTIAGLRAFDRKVILIAGGKGKGLEYDGLGREIRSRVKKLVLTGMTASQIRDAVISVPGYDGEPEIAMCDDFTKAVIEASESAGSGDIVLLSPACTSFDRFSNFEERGNLFKDIVSKL